VATRILADLTLDPRRAAALMLSIEKDARGEAGPELLNAALALGEEEIGAGEGHDWECPRRGPGRARS
jgi:hypothetical protein